MESSKKNKKDYGLWHQEKSNLREDKVRPFFHIREVWFASLGANIGFEQDGRGNKFLRPVVIIKKFNNEVCWCVPLTKNQRGGKYYYSFNLEKDKTSVVILSQIRLLDAKRLEYKIGTMGEIDFKDMKTKIIQLLG